MKRSWTALALAGAMVVQLAACGSSDGGSASSSAPGGAETALVLSDQTVTLNGSTVSQGTDGAVTVSHDIVYYQADPSAVVTLILDGVDITCTVAPAVIFYSVY